jgi:hypothetical protein
VEPLALVGICYPNCTLRAYGVKPPNSNTILLQVGLSSKPPINESNNKIGLGGALWAF